MAMKAVTLAAAGLVSALCMGQSARAADPPGAAGKPGEKVSATALATAADFTVLEAVANDAAITLTDVKHPNVVVTMTVVSTSRTTQHLALSAQPFYASNGVTVPVDLLVDGKAAASLVLQPGKSYRVQLSASLLVEGPYRSHVTFSNRNDARPRAPLKHVAVNVARTLVDVPIEVTTPPVIALIAPVNGTASTEAMLLVQSRAGALALRVPTAVKAERKPKADSPRGVQTAIEAVTELPKATDGKEMKSDSFFLPADRWVKTKVKLSGIGGPGAYEVTMRFDQAGYKAVDKLVHVYARWDSWVPFVLIVLGVLASLAVQTYVKITRPRLQVQGHVAEMRAAIEAARQKAGDDPPGNALVTAIETALRERWDKGRAARRVAATDFEVYERIVAALPLWIDLHRRRAGLRPASAGAQLQQVLDEASRAFSAAKPDAARVDAAIKALEEAPAAIRAAVTATLKTAAENLAAQLKGDHRAEVVQLRNRVERVRALVADGDVDQGVVEWMAALREHLQRFSDDLLRRVADAAPKPMGFDDAGWASTRQRTLVQVEAALGQADVEEGGSRLQQAIRDLQNELASAKEQEYAGLDPDVQDRLDPAMEAMRRALQGDDTAAIWRALDAVDRMRTGRRLGDASGAPVDEAPFHAGIGLDLPAKWEALGRPGAAAGAGSTRLRLDIGVSLVVVLIAGLVGVQQLWSENLTWGGSVAMLAAFLTGFATDQIAHAGVKSLLRL
jgi:tetratricopeptide (TPR) repeat protein